MNITSKETEFLVRLIEGDSADRARTEAGLTSVDVAGLYCRLTKLLDELNEGGEYCLSNEYQEALDEKRKKQAEKLEQNREAMFKGGLKQVQDGDTQTSFHLLYPTGGRRIG